MKDQTWVAVDSVGAGMHDIVLAKSTSRSTPTKPSVVAIVENVFRDA
jgi:microcompartment protein CcmK/EutM